MQQVGFKWAQISRDLPGHPRKQCRDRYLTQINRDMRKNPWTAEEERTLLVAQHHHGECVLCIVAKVMFSRFNQPLKCAVIVKTIVECFLC